ncbi:CaiB/BaiF CoA transferase family protein [Camelimonas abortus]|uniref:CaiB/BaiF CoA transferase family protein n=1 Tax=Camelimonas abortus TaxID=1017184 RepID=A0ABV7LCB2_9HYPH
MSQVLSGVRVLDFGRFIAGPYCAALLADFGADVIRIEKRGGGEDRFIAPVSDTGAGALFMHVNRNKRGVTLDPMSEDGALIVRKLVETADIVVANLPPDTLRAMKLDYESLTAVKPDIILVTASAFGSSGPYRNRVGFDAIGQAMSGAAYMTGTPGNPVRAIAPYVDFGTALGMAFGALVALMEREKSGKGQVVEGALLRTAINMMASTLIEQAALQINRKPTGNRSQTSAPSDILPTKDGHVLVAVVGQPIYERWARLMGNEDYWINDPKFANDLLRGENSELISARLAEWLARRTTAEAIAELEAARIPAAPVLTPQEVLDDPHVQATGYLQPVAYPGMEKPAMLAQPPMTLSRTPGAIRHRAPLTGEHTEEVLREAGFSGEDISRLREKGAI